MKLKIGDEILVTAGKDKGRRGNISRVFLKGNSVLVPSLNVYKRHQKALGGRKGGIIEFSRPLRIGNIAVICPKCGKQTRIGYEMLKDGTKIRICKKCKKRLDKKEEG